MQVGISTKSRVLTAWRALGFTNANGGGLKKIGEDGLNKCGYTNQNEVL